MSEKNKRFGNLLASFAVCAVFALATSACGTSKAKMPSSSSSSGTTGGSINQDNSSSNSSTNTGTNTGTSTTSGYTLTGTGTGGALSIYLSSSNVVPNGILNVTVTGGTGTFTISTTAGPLTQVSNGVYTFAFPATLTVGMTFSFTAVDSSGANVTATATITSIGSTGGQAIMLAPLQPTVQRNTQRVFTVTGGVPPYFWSIAGAGTLNAVTGTTVTFTAPATTGSSVITVTDSVGAMAYTTINCTN